MRIKSYFAGAVEDAMSLARQELGPGAMLVNSLRTAPEARHRLFNRLDETGSYGPLFQEAVRTGKSLSFIGTGERVPEDLETAGKGRLIELVLAGRPAEALPAA